MISFSPLIIYNKYFVLIYTIWIGSVGYIWGVTVLEFQEFNTFIHRRQVLFVENLFYVNCISYVCLSDRLSLVFKNENKSNKATFFFLSANMMWKPTEYRSKRCFSPLHDEPKFHFHLNWFLLKLTGPFSKMKTICN